MEMASERKRDGGIEAPAWWVQMAKAERVRAGKRVEDVAADVSYGTETGEIICAPGRVVDLEASAELC